ncbi:MAG: hypothetical protein J7500_01545 [Sphingomonas sp.]|uniref:hypothetical protein n=1 Tax=Sphingomonas sp. TaxID=28214 RepID=UPI001B130E39|nr:hypothetical protein [Sphingomonas sp.]MBO9621373.1 hypothetical protein [Sphingomonas sp.]
MNFFTQIHETQITRRARQPRAAGKARNKAAKAIVPLHRRLFPVDQSQPARARAVARAAVREVLG